MVYRGHGTASREIELPHLSPRHGLPPFAFFLHSEPQAGRVDIDESNSHCQRERLPSGYDFRRHMMVRRGERSIGTAYVSSCEHAESIAGSVILSNSVWACGIACSVAIRRLGIAPRWALRGESARLPRPTRPHRHGGKHPARSSACRSEDAVSAISILPAAH